MTEATPSGRSGPHSQPTAGTRLELPVEGQEVALEQGFRILAGRGAVGHIDRGTEVRSLERKRWYLTLPVLKGEEPREPMSG